MWVVFSLLAAFTAALVVTFTKVGLRSVPPSLAFAVQAVLILLVSWGVALGKGQWANVGRIESRAWLYLVLAGLLTAASSLLSFEALKLGPAGQAGVIDKVSIVFVVLLAWLFLREKPSWQILLGVGLMVAGVIVIALARKAA